jgi:hypothetical protein
MDLDPLTAAQFGEFVDGLDTALYVVTTTDGTELSGCLVGFATQTSIDPPRMLVCLSEKNHTLRVALGGDEPGADSLSLHDVGDLEPGHRA